MADKIMRNKDTSKKVTRFFDEQALDYKNKYDHYGDVRSFIFSERKRTVLEMLGSNFNRILDVGCGPGAYADELSKKCNKLYGIDISSRMIEIARAKNLPNADFSIGKIENLQFQDCFFDAIVCIGVLEYLDDIEKGIREVARVTKRNGVAILTAPNASSALNKLDYCMRLALRGLRSVIKIDISKSFMNYDFQPKLIHKKQLESLLRKHGFEIEKEKFHIFRISFLNRMAPKLSLFLAEKLNFVSSGLWAINYVVGVRKVGPTT